MNTHRYLKVIVSLCIGTLILFGVAVYVSAWFGVDTVPVLQVMAAVFGGELLLTAILKITEKPTPKKEKKAKEEPSNG